MGPASLGRRDRSERRTRSSREGLADLMPIEVPLQKSIIRRVQLGALPTSWHFSTITTTCDLDVEALWPKLSSGDIAVVVDRHDLGTQNIVSAGNSLWNGDALSAGLIVEDGVRGPCEWCRYRVSVCPACAS